MSIMQEFCQGRIIVKTGDLTKEPVDAIVNAANSSLMGGGGVDGAIHRAGGAQILEECKRIRQTDYPNGLPDGKAVITAGGKLPAGYVIHTVGPVWRGGTENEAGKLASCYNSSLQLALENKLSSIAFPAISTGIFGYPKQLAAKVAAAAVTTFIKENNLPEKTYFVFFSEDDMNIFIQNARLE